MEAYYLSFKEKRAITKEAHFNVDSFKTNFPNIDKQFQRWDWEIFTEALEPYFPELVREFYASYGAQEHILKHKGRVNMMPCLSSMEIMTSMDIDLKIPAAGSNSPVADRSPPSDLCVWYSSFEGLVAGEVQDGKSPHDEVLPTRDATHHSDPYWVTPVYSYHEARTLPDK
ncbi:hypothetical protein HAX54_033400 [Datura stramonium]|uniref:Uncharacterized protein n=1 Tax=Datura stramonium TaxID=4076 RepID=A0ABS8VCF5_DATST|nr:hypothetical protein [Datura stramonium]